MARDVNGPETPWCIHGGPSGGVMYGPEPPPVRIASAAAHRRATQKRIEAQNKQYQTRLKAIKERDALDRPPPFGGAASE